MPQVFIPKLLDLFRAGRFPFDSLVITGPVSDIDRAIDDTKTGKAVKAIPAMP